MNNVAKQTIAPTVERLVEMGKTNPDVRARLDRLAAVEAELDGRLHTTGVDVERMRALDAERELLLRTGGGALAGMPCTVNIGSDHYAAVVVKVVGALRCPSKIFVRMEHDKPEGRAFTKRIVNREGRAYMVYREVGKNSSALTFLKSETRLDPDF